MQSNNEADYEQESEASQPTLPQRNATASRPLPPWQSGGTWGQRVQLQDPSPC